MLANPSIACERPRVRVAVRPITSFFAFEMDPVLNDFFLHAQHVENSSLLTAH